MRRFLWILLVGVGLFGGQAWAQSPPPAPPASVEHVLMMDVSGSMGKGGYGDRTRFAEETRGLLERLLAPDGTLLRGQDPLVLFPFADPQTELAEDRKPVEGLDLGGLRPALEGLSGPGGGATDLRAALERALARPRRTPATVFWILTDNENNFQGQRSDEPFYLLLRDAPELRNVYFVPLAAPRSASGSAGAGEKAGALVLYLAVASNRADARWLDPFVKQVEKRLGSTLGFSVQAILFRPLYVREDQPLLDVGRKVFSDPGRGLPPDQWPVAARDASRYTLVLRPQSGGDSFQGRLRLTFLNRLDGWRIENARLEEPSVRELGPPLRTRAAFDRRSLSVEPRQESTDSYILTFHVPRAGRRAAPDFNAEVEMRATVRIGSEGNLQPAVDPETLSRMAQVKELTRILDLMLHQGGPEASDVRTFTVKIPVRLVGEGALGGWGTWALLLGLGGLILALAVWVGWGKGYRLLGPDGEESLRLGGVFRSHRLFSSRGEELGRLVCGPRGPRVVPAEEVLVDGEASVQDLEGAHVEFIMQPRGGEASRFRLEAGSSGLSEASREEGPAL